MGHVTVRPLGFQTAKEGKSLWDTFQLLQDQMRDLMPDGAVHNEGAPAFVAAARIKKILKARALRAKFFRAELFADPAWDMLLELYRAHLDQHRVSVTSICLASCVPNTTALRWLAALEEQRLIARRPDPLDGRRFFVALSQTAVEAMEGYFAAIGDTQPL